MLTMIFGIQASEAPPGAWRTTEKAGPDRVKTAPFPKADGEPYSNPDSQSIETC